MQLPVFMTLALFLIPYLIVGYDIIREACENVFHGNVFDENLLMVIATIGAFAIGKFFEDYAVGKSRRSITGLMDLRPDFARVGRNGALQEVSPDGR